MSFLLKKNNVKTILSSNITASETTLQVSDASKFPTLGNFLITIWDKISYPDPSDDPNMEIVKVTTALGNTFFIIRAQEETTPQIHQYGNAAEMLITAGHFTEIESAFGNYLALVNFKYSQLPVESPDGIVKTFTLPNGDTYRDGTLGIIVDKLVQQKDIDFAETTDSTFTLIVAPDSDEDIWLSYIKK